MSMLTYLEHSSICEGLRLDQARVLPPPPPPMQEQEFPLQQGLADANPDVDAVYQMLFPLIY